MVIGVFAKVRWNFYPMSSMVSKHDLKLPSIHKNQ